MLILEFPLRFVLPLMNLILFIAGFCDLRGYFLPNLFPSCWDARCGLISYLIASLPTERFFLPFRPLFSLFLTLLPVPPLLLTSEMKVWCLRFRPFTLSFPVHLGHLGSTFFSRNFPFLVQPLGSRSLIIPLSAPFPSCCFFPLVRRTPFSPFELAVRRSSPFLFFFKSPIPLIE